MTKALGASLIIFALVLPAASATGEPSNMRQGELVNLVRQDCGSCHGMTMKGGLGKPLLPQALEELTVSDINTIILDGVAGTPMPPWRGLLSNDDANWIARVLKQGLP